MFLRHGMSDDVLTQVGKGELGVGYYIVSTPVSSLARLALPNARSKVANSSSRRC